MNAGTEPAVTAASSACAAALGVAAAFVPITSSAAQVRASQFFRVAYPQTRQGQRGTFAIVIEGDVQHGRWQH